jgi:hypothetical protein
MTSRVTSVASATSDSLPSIIDAAGKEAVKHYRAYFNEVIRSPSTRKAYRSLANRFLKWAVQRDLSLASISAEDATEFMRLAHPKVVIPVRSLFRHFVEHGVLSANPFDSSHSRKMAVAARIRRLSAAVPTVADGDNFDQNRRELLAIRVISCAYLRTHHSDEQVVAFVSHLDRQLAGVVTNTSEKPVQG